MCAQQRWQSYEDVARVVLQDLRDRLGIVGVCEYETLPGSSGTSWRVEGTAVRTSDGAFLIVECRRHTTKGLSQESIGGVVYRVADTGAGGAIVVTPLPLQKGAELVATANGVAHVLLEEWSTAEEYLAKFMGQNFYKVTISEAVSVADSFEARVYRDGKLVGNGT